MKIRKPDYLTKNPTPATTFSDTSPVWTWNKFEKKLVQDGETNDRDYIQSFEDCEITKIFDKYSDVLTAVNAAGGTPANHEFTEGVVDCTNAMQDDLDRLDDIYAAAEDMRQRYNIPESVPIKDTFAYVQQEAERRLRNGNTNSSSIMDRGTPQRSGGISNSGSSVASDNSKPLEQNNNGATGAKGE